MWAGHPSHFWCFYVYALDIRGYGNSQRPPPKVWVTVDLAIRDVHTSAIFIKKSLCIESINILGWSWGTQVAGLFAQNYPQLVNKLALYAPFWRRINTEVPELKTTRMRNTSQYVVNDFRNLSQVDPAVIDEFIKQCMKYDKTSPRGSWRDMGSLSKKPILDPKGIRMPTLLIYGEFDHLIDKQDIQEFYDSLPINNKKLVVIPETDHMAHLENNHSIFQEAVKNFLMG